MKKTIIANYGDGETGKPNLFCSLCLNDQWATEIAN